MVFTNSHTQQVYLDAIVPTARTTNPETACSRAERNGAAAARAADGKRVIHLGPNLMPFAAKAWGRPGKDAS